MYDNFEPKTVKRYLDQTYAFFCWGATAPHFALIKAPLLASSAFFFDIIPAKPAIKILLYLNFTNKENFVTFHQDD